MTPANIGLPYSTSGLLRFYDNLPIHVLKEMFFARSRSMRSAPRITGREPAGDAGGVDDTALDVARTIAAKAPLAVYAVKEQLRVLQDARPLPADAFERIAELRRQACEGADFDEGLVLERRAPVFAASRATGCASEARERCACGRARVGRYRLRHARSRRAASPRVTCRARARRRATARRSRSAAARECA